MSDRRSVRSAARDAPPKGPEPASPDVAPPEQADSERVAALAADNARLRALLVEAGRLAEFGRYAAKQVHELRQPLFGVKGLAQLLLDRTDVDADEVRDFAQHIVEQADRLTGLLADLRQLAMPTPRDADAHADLNRVLLRVAGLLEWRFRKGVALRTELAAELPSLAIPSHALEQILFNLLSNALDAVNGRHAPIVQVRASRRADAEAARIPPGSGDGGAAVAMVEIAVADNGSGVAKAARAQIFETFFTTKGEEAGTGLGLAVSREIARRYGGDLALLDAPGAWSEPATTVFRLSLPASTESGGR